MRGLKQRHIIISIILTLGIATPAVADVNPIARAELREEVKGTYWLEIELPTVMTLERLEPRLPERCSFLGEPGQKTLADKITLSFNFDCGQQPLTVTDTLSLPLPTAGTLFVAQWQDGSSESQFFPRTGLSTEIAVVKLLPSQTSPFVQIRSYLWLGAHHLLSGWNHWLLLIGICLVTQSWRRLRWVTAFSCGHLLALAAAALGILNLPMLPAEACLALSVAFLVRAALRGNKPDKTGLFLLFILGILHGLGLGGALTAQGIGNSEQLLGLLMFNVGLDGVSLLAIAAITGIETLWRLGTDQKRFPAFLSKGLLMGMGSVAIAFTLSMCTSDILLGNISELEPRKQKPFLDFSLRRRSLPVATTSQNQSSSQENPYLPESLKSFFTIEPFEIRHEILVRVNQLETELVASSDGIIPIESQNSLKQQIRERLIESTVLQIDGKVVQPIIDQINFVSVGAAGTIIRETPIPEPLETAVVGVVISYITPGIPETVTLNWTKFLSNSQEIPVLLIDPESSQLIQITSEQPVLTWQNQLTDFKLPTIDAIAIAPPQLVLPLISLTMLMIAIIADRRLSRTEPTGFPLVVVRMVLPVVILAYPLSQIRLPLPALTQSKPSSAQAAILMEGLLTNVYRAFEFREENQIYDKLAMSVTGDQLTEIYLDNQQSLELEKQGGAQARIKQLEVVDIRSVEVSPDEGFDIEAEWTVGGSIIHFGHTHFRQNRYNAIVTIVPEGNSWKIKNIELIDEERLL